MEGWSKTEEVGRGCSTSFHTRLYRGVVPAYPPPPGESERASAQEREAGKRRRRPGAWKDGREGVREGG
eukprot:2548449-Rhodomonas_salina.1